MTHRPDILCLLVAAISCSQVGNSPRAVESPSGRSEWQGKVVIAGSEPNTTVQLAGSAGSVELVGPLAGELRRLAGAEVSARGALKGRRPVQRLEVQNYEVTGIDGQVPSVGQLVRKGDEFWLAGRDTLQLVDLPPALHNHLGAKLWILGIRSGPKLVVQSYGVIREK